MYNFLFKVSLGMSFFGIYFIFGLDGIISTIFGVILVGIGVIWAIRLLLEI